MQSSFSGHHDNERSVSARSLTEVLLEYNILEVMPDATVAVDANGIILQSNAQAELLFGYSRDELIGSRVEMLVPRRYRQDHQQHRKQFAHSPMPRRMGAGLELFGRRKDGSEFPVEISLNPVRMDSGTLVVSAIRDVSHTNKIASDLRRAHEELSQRSRQELGEYRARLASIVDSSDDAIIGKDLDGKILSWNQGAERIYGYTAQEMIGQNVRRLTTPDGADEISGILEKLKRGERVEHADAVRVTKDGRHLNMSITISPVTDASGNVVGASAIARDMTAQKRAEDQLRQSQKMEAIGRLAGGVAHDFNNILGIIAACSELLRDRVIPGESSQYLANIQKAIERGASLTRHLLAFSRKQVVAKRLLDVNERLADVIKLLRPLMGDDVTISTSLKAPSPIIEADPSQLDQVILNLAVNARDAMPKGGKFILETSMVDLDEAFVQTHRSAQVGRHVVIAVSDTGHGMDEATVARMFEPFFTTKEPGKGTGLGLSTVYGIVQQSGGHIWVYSEPGRGTSFKIYFPSAEGKVHTDTRSATAEVRPRGEGKVLLLVEDDEIMRRLTRELLEQQGYKVLEAGDGQAALDLAAQHNLDLLLTDVVMRGLSGPQLAESLRKAHPHIKVVFMSGYTGELIEEHESLHGEVTLLEKPFTRSALLDKLEEAQ